MSLIILQVIPSPIGYIIIVLILTVLPGPSSRCTTFQRWAKLTSTFLVLSFRLVQQAWLRVCDVPMVPITFRFIISLTWCRRRSITSLRNLSINVSWSSSTFWCSSRISIEFMMRNKILAPQWFKLSSTTFLPSPTQTCSYNFGNTSFWHVDGLLLKPSATSSSFPWWNCT